VPEDCVGDQGLDAHLSNLRDVHRRYAEVITAEVACDYLAGVTAGAQNRGLAEGAGAEVRALPAPEQLAL
jgi:hypothetical protein